MLHYARHELRQPRGLRLITYFILVMLVAHGGVAAELRCYPTKLEFESMRNTGRIVVTFLDDDLSTRHVAEEATIRAVDDALVKVVAGVVYPLQAGKTELHVTWKQYTATVPVSIGVTDSQPPINFQLDVMPIFTKSGCNSGTCHGASRGQDGFHLSLFGYDPGGDYFRITREMGARRINLAIPESSLLLEKATGKVAHTGGKRLEADSIYFHTIQRWLEQAAPDAPADTPTVARIEMQPPELVLRGIGQQHPVVVTAYLSDGTTRDVTELTSFFSSDPASVNIDERGGVTAKSRGESFVSGRFDVHTVGLPVIVLPEHDNYQTPPVADNYIDQQVDAKLQKLRYAPASRCTDEQFLRRVTIDLAGRLPTIAEIESFVADNGQDKRELAIDKLLDGEAFDDLWTAYWADALMVQTSRLIEKKPAYLYHAWLRDRIKGKTRFDEIVYELLTSTGSTFDNPSTNFYAGERDRKKVAENVAQVFLGIRVQCAQCHNHPFDRWTMDDYYGFAAFFHHVARKRGEDYREWIVLTRGGNVKHPVTNANVAPKFLGGDQPTIEGKTRCETVAQWITAPDNPYFAKNIANRVWSLFFGRGIVDPVDDFRISNPPSNPDLLATLGQKLIEYEYDVRRLARDIVLSNAYQRSSQHAETGPLVANFGRAQYRRIPAAVLLDCVSQVTNSPGNYEGLENGDKAVNIPIDNNYFLKSFGRSDRDSVCACESKSEPTLSQALHLINGQTTNGKIQGGKLIEGWLAEHQSVEDIILQLYLRCLSRQPTETEWQNLLQIVADSANPTEGLQDIFWALLNSREFVFNH